MGVAVDEVGDLPSTFAAGQMYRQGNRWLLAVSKSMGTAACCMTLFGVRLMGSNVLKYTRMMKISEVKRQGLAGLSRRLGVTRR